MKVEVKKIDTLKRELRFEIPKDRFSQVLDDVYKDLGKTAKVKGFRQGKVPRHILETNHGQLAQEEAIRKIIPEVYHEGITKESLLPVDMPEIHNVNLKGGVLTFTAKIDTRPEVNVKDYKGIKVKRKSNEVSDEELEKTLEMFQKGQGGDQEKESKIKLDDAFAKGLGYPSLDEFKKSLKRQLEFDKERHNKFDVENQVVEWLLKKNKVEAPASIVQKQVERRWQSQAQHLKSHGIKEEDVQKKEEEFKKQIEEAVIKDVKAYFILEKIAEVEKLSVNHEQENLPAKVMEFLLKEANWEGEK